MITMKAVKDIILRALPDEGYRMELRTEKAKAMFSEIGSGIIWAEYLDIVQVKLREMGLSFGFSR